MGKKIIVSNSKHSILFELNNSNASQELYNRLPLSINIENYSDNEKIFVAEPQLPTKQTPLAKAVVGTMAYFSPFRTVCLFYGDFGSYNGLYELGTAVENKEYIKELSGNVQIERFNEK